MASAPQAVPADTCHSSKTALITGGTRGIGFGIARCLAQDGFTGLVLGYSSNHARAQEATAQLEEEFSGLQVHCFCGDLAKPATLDLGFAAVRQHLGNRLTAFIHNAGLWPGLSTEQTDAMPTNFADEDLSKFQTWMTYFHDVYAVAFKRGLLLGQQCEGFKHAIGISFPGVNMNTVPKLQSEYPGVGKAAMEYLCRVNAVRLGPKGITVNIVSPGIIQTEAWLRTNQDGRAKSRVSSMPLDRWGRAEDVGHAVAFLCSERGAFITGVVLPVDGGMHLVGNAPAQA